MKRYLYDLKGTFDEPKPEHSYRFHEVASKKWRKKWESNGSRDNREDNWRHKWHSSFSRDSVSGTDMELIILNVYRGFRQWKREIALVENGRTVCRCLMNLGAAFGVQPFSRHSVHEVRYNLWIQTVTTRVPVKIVTRGVASKTATPVVPLKRVPAVARPQSLPHTNFQIQCHTIVAL